MLIEITTQLSQSLADAYYVAIVCPILQVFRNELLLLHVNSKFNEFGWRTNGLRRALLPAKLWEV